METSEIYKAWKLIVKGVSIEEFSTEDLEMISFADYVQEVRLTNKESIVIDKNPINKAYKKNIGKKAVYKKSRFNPKLVIEIAEVVRIFPFPPHAYISTHGVQYEWFELDILKI